MSPSKFSNPASRLARAAGRGLAALLVVVAGVASLVGSGGGGGGGGGGTAPPALTVIGTTPTNGATGVAASSTVSASFSENLANTPTFTLAGGAGAVTGTVSRTGSTATFTPAAALALGTTYTATVSGANGSSGGAQSGATTWTFTTVADPNAPPITISGVVDFESVPADTATNGRLLYANTVNKPIRGATIEVLTAAGGALLASATSGTNGAYSVTITGSQSVIVRVRAAMKKTAGAGGTWDFSVRDNTQGDAPYVMDSTAFVAVAGTNTRNLRALSGWGGSSYTGTRVAAPFAILDVVYDTSQKVLTASPNAAFPALQLMWSKDNQPTGGNLATGFIGTSFYQFTSANGHRIYILGAADSDTDEYDRPVLAHEFGHYLQSTFSRDDSIGGSHSGGDRLDMRVAFSEGWGNAWAGMALSTQYYTDSGGASQQSGFVLDLAQSPVAGRGWYNERSVQYLMYQWHASPSIGFTPIFNVLAGMPTSLPADGAVSSIHSFASRLKLAVPGQASAIDGLLTGQQIIGTGALGVGETNSGNIPEALPVYRTHSAAIGAPQNYCLSDAAGTADAEFNKLGANLFIRFTLGAAGSRTIVVAQTTAAVTSDPDFTLIRSDGTKQVFESTGNTENTGVIQLAAGTHLIVLSDYALTEGNGSAANNGQRCFNVTIQ